MGTSTAVLGGGKDMCNWEAMRDSKCIVLQLSVDLHRSPPVPSHKLLHHRVCFFDMGESKPQWDRCLNKGTKFYSLVDNPGVIGVPTVNNEGVDYLDWELLDVLHF